MHGIETSLSSCATSNVFPLLAPLDHPPPPPYSATSNVFPLLTPLDHPPRPPPPPPSSASSARHLAGYNPARGDFSSLPDPSLELLLANLAAPESDLEQELQCTLVRAYNCRLKHRLRKFALVSCSFQITRQYYFPLFHI